MGTALATVAPLAGTAGLGGSAFGLGGGGGGPSGGSGGGFGTGGGGGGGIFPGSTLGSGSGVNFHGGTCQVTGRVALGVDGRGPAIRFGTVLVIDGQPACLITLG
ncbi:MAG: hypothetical protein ACKOA9_00590 [Actinomycetota bacterium]